MADDEIIENQPKNEPEPLVVETKGKWQPFEVMTGQELEVGKTYNITVKGKCEFAISKDRPFFGLATNEIRYTKDNENILWIKTGG